MRTPTLEQMAVLNSPARVRVVRAAPGSGKTWLVAELIRRELGAWPTKTSGIAALSFTRVGGDEIRKAVGYELTHPHFVGTIDAFLFRYVVRPFLTKCYPGFATPRLIPAEWTPNRWDGASWQHRGRGGGQAKSYNLFDVCFIGETNQGSADTHPKPLVAYPRPYSGGVESVSASDQSDLLEKKKNVWTKYGYLTHADAALLASAILSHKRYGPLCRREIVCRFPLIIVDELQDTGYFLGKSIRLLLNEPTARGVLVGDPDQAIFEFTGARPDLFDSFEAINGAVKFPLSNSQRCPAAITDVAAYLKDGDGGLGSCSTNSGRAFLVRYDNMSIDIYKVANTVVTMQNGTSVKVITRQTSTLEELIGHRTQQGLPKLGCPSLNHMLRAVMAFRQRRNVAAWAATRAALERAVFQYEGVEDTELEKYGIEQSRWKRLAVDCLLRANSVETTGSLYDWETRVGRILDEELNAFGLNSQLSIKTGKLKPKKTDEGNRPCADFLSQTTSSPSMPTGIPIRTVHGVKGETHDVTIFVCPDTNARHCPSEVWWSTDEKNREEKRIAYVAVTRSRGHLIVCVSNNCYKRLLANRTSFANSFECMTSDEFIATFGQYTAALQPAGDIES